MEVLFCAAAGNLAYSKEIRNWVMLNTIILTTFLTKAIIVYGQASETEIIKTFSSNIAEHNMKTPEELQRNGDKYRSNKEKTARKKKYKYVLSRKEAESVSAAYNFILAFIQVASENPTKLASTPLSLCMDKHERE